jgi:hypothetical protein
VSAPVRKRRKLAMAELVLGVAGSYAVTEPGSEAEIRDKYSLTQADMDKIKGVIGDRLEAWAIRLGYDEHWGDRHE